MLSSKRNIGVFALLVILTTAMCSIFFNTDTSIMAQRPQRDVKIVTPGYYYVAPSSVTQNATTSLITLNISDFVRLQNYPTGLQVVFTTEEDNDTTAAVTLKIGHLPAKKLLTRHGQEFNLLELDAGVIMTATYDGTDFISDYTAARSLAGILVATASIPAGTYSNHDYVTWTLPSTVTQLTLSGTPVGSVLQFPDSFYKSSQLGWFYEIRQGTTVIYQRLRPFGYISALTADNIIEGELNLDNFTYTGRSSGSIRSWMRWDLDADLTTTHDYTINLYVAEN